MPGDHLRQQSIVSSLDKIALDETAIKDTDKNDLIALQSEVDKGYKQPDSNVRCTNEFLAHGESKKNDRMHLNQDACDSSSMCRPDVNPGEHEEALCSSVRRSAMHVDGMYSNSVEDSGRFAIEAVNHDEALPKMLSGALETVDSKHVQEKIRLINRIGICTRSDISTENAGDGCQHTLSYRKSSVAVSPIRSESESDDYGSSVVNETCQSDVESVVKKRFLSLLHEFAAMKQSEGEHLITPSDMASCIENFVNSDAFVCESRRLNFVNLIRKKMGHAGVLTDFMTDDIYQEILQKNKGFLGTIAGNDLAFLIPPTGISTNGGCVTTLCSEEKGDAIPNQKSNVPSLDATADSLLEDVDHELSNLAETPGKDFEEQSKLFVVKEEANSDAMKFSVGDLVWAKVKSHPWWPGQIFDAQDASAAAKKKQKPDRLLVAFFGDGTYGWLQESQLIPFIPNFADKVKQSPAKRFCKAVAGALDEVCKRTELGLRCLHSSEEIYSLNVFPDSNLGVRRGVRIRCHQDIEVSKSKFQPTKVLKFIQAAACCPIYPLSSGLEYSEVLGHVYGFRSFMLSPHMEESKITLLNMLNSHKTVKASRSSTLKRRHGMDEFSTVLNAEMGQEVKRKHVSKDVSEDEIKGPLTGSRVESPRSRSMGTSMSEIAEQSKPPISEDKSSELAKRGISLAVDKFCPSVSSEREETGGHRSLELPESGVKATANMLTSVDDDSKTLFDMTGLYSLKKRKKSALVSVSNAEGRMTNQQPFEVVQQEQPKKLDASMIMEDKTCPLDSGAFLNATGPCPRLKDARSMEDEIDKLGQLDSKDDAESYEKVEGERLGASANCAEDIIEKEESQLFHLEVTDSEQNGEDKRHLEASGKEKYGIDEERNHIGLLRQSIKKVSEVLHSGKTANDNEELSADLKESEAYLDAAEKDLKKQWKCLHPEAAGTPRLLEVSKKKKGDIEEKESLLLDTSYNEEEFTGRILKTFKLGESGRKSIGAWRVAPPSLKQTKHISSSKVSFTADDKPEDVKIAKSQALPQIAIVSAGGKDIQGHRMSLPRLLSTLKLVAMDPLRSADGESSFDGVMPVFLRFRNMVFVKSSGYVAASSGKLMSSIADGHILRTRKQEL
ncbi:hypothetical protein KP509_24G040200 [Ceratopteris richardii]|uniref:PWWP domain-containing protein n=1 Tax=Ceratopteris richardii TaxID=49495 RepID=A0A8T2RWM3_CERRI|nr:hypothetical protein KP509_24G040200 [Ceratopteris richardii]